MVTVVDFKSVESIEFKLIKENSLNVERAMYFAEVRAGKAKGLRAVEVLRARLKNHSNYKKRPQSKERSDRRKITYCQDFHYCEGAE